MAKMESKSFTVAPDEEQDVIAKHELFGWELLSSQEVLSRDSHFEERAGDLYSVTTTQNYVKLVFQRDTERADFSKVESLEKEYWNLYERTKWGYAPKKSKLFSVAPLVICGIAGLGAVYSLFAAKGASFGERLVAFLFFVAVGALMYGIRYAYNRFIFAPKERKYYAARQRKEDIEEEAKSLAL